MDDPLITITTNLYNYERFIGDCIKSVLNQTYDNFEFIIVDDCSEDNSYKIAKSFKDKRIKIIKVNKNRGIGHAKNLGISISKGKYIVTLDADDMLTKNSLEVRVKAILKNNVPFVYADAIWFKGMTLNDVYKLKSVKISNKKWPRRHNSNNIYNIHSQTVMASREVYKEYGLYDEDLRCKVDREMWLRLFGKKGEDDPKIKSFYLKEIVAYYRWHSKQVSKKRHKDTVFNKKNTKLCEKKYQIRKKCINEINTRFLKE